ncbi:MAG: hypothetical protein ABF370_12080 [Verrucomicrobiales bacterium]
MLAATVLNDGISPDAPRLELMETSSADGEDGVAITRESILRFDKPLPDNASVDTAIFAGETLKTHKQLSADRLTLTLFYT